MDFETSPKPKTEILASLRQKIRQLEGFKTDNGQKFLHFDLKEIDEAFPDGCLPAGAIHEFLYETAESVSATMSFIAALLSRLQQDRSTILWVSRSHDLYAPGLLHFGIDPSRILFLSVRREKEALWAIEEGLRAKGILAVIGEISLADLTATRRLQLAVEKSGTTGFLLRDVSKHQEYPSVCVSRWRILPLPSQEANGLPGVGPARWHVALEKIRHGRPGQWEIEWLHNRFGFAGEKPAEFPLQHRRETA